MHSGPASSMINSSPVRPHELQLQSLIGAITTSSLRVLATSESYDFNRRTARQTAAATSLTQERCSAVLADPRSAQLLIRG
jgi:hypothetical protein